VTSDNAIQLESRIRELLIAVLRPFVDHPDRANVVLHSNPEESVFSIGAHPADIAKLTANGERIGRALDCVIGAIGRKLGKRFTLAIAGQTNRSHR
jgi:predicted RNA-binding protein YlqC (UPF0109 family)